jgi:GT2 family glycosyltransferase
MDQSALPMISVVVTTRDRSERVTGPVRTTLQNDYPRFDLTLVDQSEDGGTALALEPYLRDPRVHYVRTSTRGLARGRNRGIDAASGELIALTDDDCEVATDWLQEIAAAFALDRRIGIVFGNVLPAPHDRRAGFVPACVSEQPFLARSVRQKVRVEGMGACMAVRRNTWEALGGFDEMLGAGAPLKAGDEGDLAIRALLAGHFVYETPAVTVTHHGFRGLSEGRALIDDYWYGTGAIFAKHLRCRRMSLVPMLPRLAYRWAWGHSPVAASLDRPYRTLRLTAFVRGLGAGGTAPIDCHRGHYVRGDGALNPEAARLGSHPDG